MDSTLVDAYVDYIVVDDEDESHHYIHIRAYE